MINILQALNIPETDLIRNEASLAEKTGKLTNAQLSVIYKNNWFHLLVPKSLGGEEMPLPEFAKFMEHLAAIDGSFAWNVNLGAGANMFAGFMEQTAASKIFANKKTCVAGSGSVGGSAEAKNDGFIINGHWKYASGSAHATYFSLNALLVNGKNNEYASFLVPAAEVELLNTWNVFGMKATSSCEFKVNNIWVPKSYIFDLQKPSPAINSALYRFPFMQLAEINMLVMITGLAIHFYEQIVELAKEKVLTNRDQNKGLLLFDLPIFKEASNISSFLEKRDTTFFLLEQLWQEVINERKIPNELSSSFSKSVSDTATAARQLVDILYPFAGMKVVFQDTEISRIYRDFKVASQHALLSPTALIW